MNRNLIAAAVTSLVISVAHAQPGANDTPITALLEKRVPEELAAEGLVLSRRNLSLRVEQVGDQLIISLVDLSTGRVAASTKLEHIPPDREAAVARVTHVAADLAGQAGAAPVTVPVPVVVDDRAEREQRQLAEMKFQRERLHFDHVYTVVGTNNSATMSRHWVALRGDLDLELAPSEFYQLVGRGDLAETYLHRRRVAIASIAVGTVAMLAVPVTLAIGFSNNRPDYGHCLGATDFTGCTSAEDQRVSDARQPYLIGGGVLLGVGLVGTVVGVWYAYHVHPISESDAKGLADDYNQGLRHQLGLPTVARRSRPLLRDVHVVPYTTGRDSGVVLGGRF
jgi:hypothetical protein